MRDSRVSAVTQLGKAGHGRQPCLARVSPVKRVTAVKRVSPVKRVTGDSRPAPRRWARGRRECGQLSVSEQGRVGRGDRRAHYGTDVNSARARAHVYDRVSRVVSPLAGS